MLVIARLLCPLALALGAAALPAFAQNADRAEEPSLAADAPAPVGLDVNGTEYVLASNGLWKVSGDPAKQMKILVAKRQGATDAFGRQDHAIVWARTCTAAAQTVVFRRDLFMPGPPKNFAAFFETPDITHRESVAGVSVLINGRLALTVTAAQFFNGYGRVDIALTTAKYPKLFIFGLNTVEVKVTKRAQSGSVGACVSSSKTRFGMHFSLSGKFEADLLVPPVPPKYENVFVTFLNTKHSIILHAYAPGNYPIQNRGPSGIYRGTFTISIAASSFPGLEIVEVTRKGPEMGPCIVTQFGPSAARIDCKLNRWKAGERPGVTVRYNVTIGNAFTYAKHNTYVELKTPTGDPILNNNSDFFWTHLCANDGVNLPPICAKARRPLSDAEFSIPGGKPKS